MLYYNFYKVNLTKLTLSKKYKSKFISHKIPEIRNVLYFRKVYFLDPLKGFRIY